MDIDSLDPNAFATTTRETWLKLVERTLKGADFATTLISRTDDGIAIEPLYDRLSDPVPLARRLPDAPWTISQRMDDPDVPRGLLQLVDDISNGATGISLISKTGSASFGTGLDPDKALAAKVVGAIRDKDVSLRLEGCPVAFVEALTAAFGNDAGSQRFHLGLNAFASEEGIRGADTVRSLNHAGFSGTIFNADGRTVHNAGGTEAQELAAMAASLTGHLRILDDAGVDTAAALGLISLCLAADQDQFVSMAKARAARLIFARIAEACGVATPPAAHLFMETSYRMLTRLDPETNILRNTVAAFVAGTGGADEISVLPHTLAHGLPDPLARRLARNTQLILIAECHLDHVSDPAAGAGGIEALTEALAEKAWDIFTGIERDGGWAKMIADGGLAAMVAAARDNRAERPIVGTTLFPMTSERPVSVLAAVDGGDTRGLAPRRLDQRETGR